MNADSAGFMPSSTAGNSTATCRAGRGGISEKFPLGQTRAAQISEFPPGTSGSGSPPFSTSPRAETSPRAQQGIESPATDFVDPTFIADAVSDAGNVRTRVRVSNAHAAATTAMSSSDSEARHRRRGRGGRTSDASAGAPRKTAVTRLATSASRGAGPAVWRRDMPLAARLSGVRSEGEVVLTPIARRGNESDVPTVPLVFSDAPQPTAWVTVTRFAVTLVGSRAAVDRFLKSAPDDVRQSLPLSSDISILPLGVSGGLCSHQWVHDAEFSDKADALVAAFNRATMADANPFLGHGSVCVLSAKPPSLQRMLMVRPLTVKTSGNIQRAPRWQAPCWPTAMLESMPADLRPTSVQFDVDATGRAGLAITPAAGRWLATRRWLVENELVVTGAEQPPSGSYRLSVDIQGAGVWVHTFFTRAKEEMVARQPGLLGRCSWGAPVAVGTALHVDLETAMDWTPDPTQADFYIAGPDADAPKARVTLMSAARKAPRAATPAADPARSRTNAPNPAADELEQRDARAWPGLPARPAATTADAVSPAERPPAATTRNGVTPAIDARRRAVKRRLDGVVSDADRDIAGRTAPAAGAAAKAMRPPSTHLAQGETMDVDPRNTAPEGTAPRYGTSAPPRLPPTSCWDPPSGTPDPKDAPALGSYHKYYAVAVGRQTGVVDSWPKAWAMTHRWPLNRFAGFDDYPTAESFVKRPWTVGSTDRTRGRSRSAAARGRPQGGLGAAASASGTVQPRPRTMTPARAPAPPKPAAAVATDATRYVTIHTPADALQEDLDTVTLFD